MYEFLGENNTQPVIVNADLNSEHKDKLLQVLRKHKKSFGWIIFNLESISPSTCMHRIFLEDNCKPVAQMQRMLNPNIKEVVKSKIPK